MDVTLVRGTHSGGMEMVGTYFAVESDERHKYQQTKMILRASFFMYVSEQGPSCDRQTGDAD